MTTANESGGSSYQTFFNQYAHAQPLLWILTACTGIWQIVTEAPIANQISWVMTAVLWASFLAEYKHARSLCEKCAFLTPLNTELAVLRNMRWLKGIHWVADHPGKTILILIGFLATTFVPVKVLQMAGILGLDVTLGAQTLCALKHRVLAPWCPMCRWDDGGDEEFVPEPAPPPGINADR